MLKKLSYTKYNLSPHDSVLKMRYFMNSKKDEN